MGFHDGFDIIPKIDRNNLVDTGIAQDSKLPVFNRKVNIRTPLRSLVLCMFNRANRLAALIQYITLKISFNMHPDFTGCIQFGLSNCLFNEFPFFGGEKLLMPSFI